MKTSKQKTQTTAKNKPSIKNNIAKLNRFGLGYNDALDFVLNKDIILEYQKYELQYNFEEYVPFLSDDNYLFTRIDFLAKGSPTLGAIIANKTHLISSGGFNVYEAPTKTIINGLKKSLKRNIDNVEQIQELNDYFNDVDNDKDLQEVISKVTRDYITYGNAFVQLIKYKGTRFNENGVLEEYRKLIVKHTPLGYCRPKVVRNRDEKRYIGVSADFEKGIRLPTNVKDIPMYPNFEEVDINGDAYERTIIHLKDYQPNFYYWGVPDWIDCNLFAEIEYRIARFNISQFENGFAPSAIITMGGATSDPEDVQEFTRYFQESFTNTGNDAKVLFYMLENPDYKIDAQILSDIREGQFTELQKLCAQQIITGCNWTTSLAGIPTPGKLGSNQQLRSEFSLIENMVLKPIQNLIDRKLINPIIQEAGKYMGYDWGMIHAELATNNPLDLSTELDLNAVLTPNEKRELLGYEPLDETQLAILNAMENDNTNQQAGNNNQQV